MQGLAATLFQDRQWLLFDGAMGTYLAERSGGTGMKCEMANLQAPALVAGIHREYIDAGADAIKTNTFAANTAVLQCPMEQVLQIVDRGWQIATEAAQGRAVVFADIGPIPEDGDGDVYQEYRQTMDRFLALGARHFLFETFAQPEPILRCADYIKARVDAVVIASFAVHPDGYTRGGISGEAIGRHMETSAAVDAWGFNCISGPYYLQQVVKSLGVQGKPRTIMPNAGHPALEDGRTVYRNNAGYFAQTMAAIRDAGVRILGGCCGTTPEHIRRTAEALRQGQRGPSAVRIEVREVTAAAPNRFWERLSAGRTVIAAEADPPMDIAVGPMLEGVAQLRDAGADIITVADSPLARPRADGVMMSSLIARRCAVEVMPHLACRDRNLNAMKALLLSAHIEGIRNLLAITGDPVAEADRNDVKGVFNFHSSMLAGYIGGLNDTVFHGDGMRVGAALNVNATNLESELKRAQRKVEQGVAFFLTQPIYSAQAEEAFLQAAAQLGRPILAGLMPLVSHRNARFIANEVPGIRIPEEVVEQFCGLKRAEAERLGIEMALATARRLSGAAQGYFVITPLGRYGVSGELISRIRRQCND